MLFEIVKCDGTREKVQADCWIVAENGDLQLKAFDHDPTTIRRIAAGVWLEVWRREGVSE